MSMTPKIMAEALDCFWNASIGEAHRSQEGGVFASIMATGFAAVAERLREFEPETTKALADVTAERRRQIEVEGWTQGHDDAHANGEIAFAAAAYARHAGQDEDSRQVNSGFHPEDLWPAAWWVFWKPSNRRRDLVKAGALILAEIERLDRLAAKEPAA